MEAGEIILKLDTSQLDLGLSVAQAQLEIAEADVLVRQTEISRAETAWSRAHEMESLAEAEALFIARRIEATAAIITIFVLICFSSFPLLPSGSG